MQNRDNKHIREYLKVLRKRRALAARFFAVIFGLVLVWTFIQTPQYRGTTKVIIEKIESTNLTDRPREERADYEFYQTQFQLLKSDAVAVRVVEMLQLDENFDAVAPYLGARAKFRVPINLWISDLKKKVLISLKPSAQSAETSALDGVAGKETAANVSPLRENIASMLSKGLTVQPISNSHITDISFLSSNPEFSALVANTYAAAYLDETLNMKMEATRRNLGWMTNKANTEREKLEKREAELQAYMKENDLVALEDRVAIVPQKLLQLGRELVTAEARRKELSLLYKRVNKVSNDLDAAETVLSINEGGTLQILRAQILQSEQNIMEISSKYGKKHPSMIKALADLNILKDKRQQEIRRLTQKVRDQYELARENEQSLNAQMESAKAEAMTTNEKFAQYTSLKREIDTNRQLYDRLLAKIKDNNITGETQPVSMWIVEEAKVSNSPAKPWVGINIILGILVGLLGAVLGTFMVDYMDNTIKSPEDIEERLEIALLGVVPRVDKKGSTIEGIVSREPNSNVAESYNHLRTSLQLSSADRPPRSILVTSALPNEGKTSTSVNLALSMAKSGSHVLLMDGDLRNPHIHKIFDLKNRVGLSSYLAGKTDDYLLQKGPVPNLSIITSGPIPPNPTELIASKRFQALIGRLLSNYDIVICDSPPVLSVTDSRVLSQFFDGVLFVCRAAQTPYPIIERGVRHLKDVNAQTLGLVLNGLDTSHGADYYPGYYYGYQQQDPSEA